MTKFIRRLVKYLPILNIEKNKFMIKNNEQTQKQTQTQTQKQTQVHIIGNGWSAYHFAKNLDKTKYVPIIIAPNEKVLDTTKLINKLVDINTNLEFENPYANIIIDTVDDINIETKQIITNNNIFEYKYIVIAIGSETNIIPNLEKDTNKINKIKTINDINELSQQINQNTTLCIIGGRVTGIELATKLSKYVSNIKIIETFDTILFGFNEKTQQYITNYIKKNTENIEILYNTKVNNLNDYDKNDIIIWTAGVRFNGYKKTKLYESLNNISEIKPREINVDDNFSIHNNIFCIGDIVANKGPPTAQNSKKQAEWLSNYFNNDFNIKDKFESNITTKIIHLDDKIYIENKYKSILLSKIFSQPTQRIIDYFCR